MRVLLIAHIFHMAGESSTHTYTSHVFAAHFGSLPPSTMSQTKLPIYAEAIKGTFRHGVETASSLNSSITVHIEFPVHFARQVLRLLDRVEVEYPAWQTDCGDIRIIYRQLVNNQELSGETQAPSLSSFGDRQSVLKSVARVTYALGHLLSELDLEVRDAHECWSVFKAVRWRPDALLSLPTTPWKQPLRCIPCSGCAS